MINIFSYKTLGHHDYGWLKARYHFSFAEYHDPSKLGLGTLRVVNDDIIKPGGGYTTRPQYDMELITYVRRGVITYSDSLGNEGRIGAGSAQVISAGTGIQYTSSNEEDTDTHLYNIWITPREKGIPPSWKALAFSREHSQKSLPVLVSGNPQDQEKGALPINADAIIYGGPIMAHTTIQQNIDELGYILVAEGEIKVDGQVMKKGDGGEIITPGTIQISAIEDSEILLIDVPV